MFHVQSYTIGAASRRLHRDLLARLPAGAAPRRPQQRHGDPGGLGEHRGCALPVAFSICNVVTANCYCESRIVVTNQFAVTICCSKLSF